MTVPVGCSAAVPDRGRTRITAAVIEVVGIGGEGWDALGGPSACWSWGRAGRWAGRATLPCSPR